MRIAVFYWTTFFTGGAEAFLARLVPELLAKGHEIAFVYEVGVQGEETRRLSFPPEVETWSLQVEGESRALRRLRAWKPDVIYDNGLDDPRLEAALGEIAPLVISVHNYYGLCISGHKATRFPMWQPCSRELGPACLLRYFPRGCGGRNPRTMLSSYRLNAARLENLRGAAAVVAHSDHMRAELARHGVAAERIFYLLGSGGEGGPRSARAPRGGRGAPTRVAFAGRMEAAKGGLVLADALVLAARALGRSLEAVFIGDGTQRMAWQERAERLGPEVSCTFTGWLSGGAYEETLASADVLAFPSLWPEPFGLVGLEAARLGVPAAAFGSGGVRDWLVDGVGGAVAPDARTPTAQGLAEALVRVLRTREECERLSEGARATYARFAANDPVRELLHLFERLARGRAA